MSMESVDYTAILADLEAKKTALEQTIASLRAALALGAVGQMGDASMLPASASTTIHAGDIPEGAFLGKSIPEAARLYLGIVKKKQTSVEIAEALRKYGLESKSANFPKILHAVLDRVRRTPDGGITKLGRSHWGLSEWYHPGLRTVSVPEKRSNRKPKKERKAHAGKKVRSVEPAVRKVSEIATVPERIWQLLKDKKGSELSAQEIGISVGIQSNVAALLLGKLISQKCVEKTATGKYRAIAA